MYEADMIASLHNLPGYELDKDVKIKHAFPGDKEKIMKFIEENFNKSWSYEAEHSMMQEYGKCFIATIDGKIVGFSCFDASARGFFGPIGVLPEVQNKKIGKALLIHTLEAMKAYGYGYAIIGWVSSAAGFYEKVVGAEYIKGATPENSVYSNLVFM